MDLRIDIEICGEVKVSSACTHLTILYVVIPHPRNELLGGCILESGCRSVCSFDPPFVRPSVRHKTVR